MWPTLFAPIFHQCAANIASAHACHYSEYAKISPNRCAATFWLSTRSRLVTIK
jgi:hypothetical protein